MNPTRQTKANIAVVAVAVLALLVTVAAFRQAMSPAFRPLEVTDVFVLAIMLTLVVILELIRVSVPQSKFGVSFSVFQAVFVAASIGYGAIVGVALAAIGTLVTELFYRKPPRKVIFNVTQFVCAAGIAGLVYHALLPGTARAPLATLHTIIVALFAVLLDLLVNAALVSIVVGLSIGKPPIAVLIANLPGVFVQNITLYSIGLLLASMRFFSPYALPIALLPLFGPYLAMRGHRETLLEIRKTIEALADTVDRRDTSTAQHSERVANYTQQIIDEIGTISFAEAEAIILAARVHDLGKIAIPDAVLLKPGRLDEGEYWLMRQHPIAGDDILQRLAIYKDSLGVVRHHHERYDGTGYPDGLKGDEIPLGARIVAVADSYDVMTSDRPYARARSVREATEELLWSKGTHFDPKIVDAFVHILTRQHAPTPAEVALTGASRVPTTTV